MGEDLMFALEKDESSMRLYQYTYAKILVKKMLKEQLITDIEFKRTIHELKKTYRIKD